MQSSLLTVSHLHHSGKGTAREELGKLVLVLEASLAKKKVAVKELSLSYHVSYQKIR